MNIFDMIRSSGQHWLYDYVLGRIRYAVSIHEYKEINDTSITAVKDSIAESMQQILADGIISSFEIQDGALGHYVTTVIKCDFKGISGREYGIDVSIAGNREPSVTLYRYVEDAGFVPYP